MKKNFDTYPHGDHAACAALIEQHSAYIRRVIAATLRRYGSRTEQDEAEDFYNNFYVHISEDNWRRLRSYKGNSSIKTFLSTVTANHLLDILRKRKEHVTLDDEDIQQVLAPNLSPEQRCELLEAETILRKCMANLKPHELLLLKLIFYNELPPRNISAILNISAKAVSDRKSRVVEKMKICAENHGLHRL